MSKITLKLDTRRANASGRYPVQLQLSHNSKCTSISTGVYIRAEHWCGEINRAVSTQCPNAKQINSDLEALYFKYGNALRELDISGKLRKMSVVELRKAIMREQQLVEEVTFNTYFTTFIARKEKETTQSSYRHTLSKIEQFAAKEGRGDDWAFEDITLDWLNRFERHLKLQHIDNSGNEIGGAQKLRTNGIAIHLRNIRAVVNAAIDEELTALYPFRKFKIKQEQTAKRSLTLDELRTLRDYPCEAHQERYRDLFMLIFYLIGINTIDLFSLTEIRNGRIEYRRSKTGRLFSIKVEPEAQAIIDKYRGEGYLLDVLDAYHNYKDFAHRMNYNLQQIGDMKIVKDKADKLRKKERSPILAKLTTYWARHTWATIAADLDIPDETISLALGHSSGNRVTNIYINRNLKKVDEANRKVIDYLLGDGGKEPSEKEAEAEKQ